MVKSMPSPARQPSGLHAEQARARVITSLEALATAETEAENENNILCVVALLHESPHKINNVLLYLDANSFKKYLISDSFHHTLIYMRRIPKKWVTTFLASVFPGLSDMLSIWNKGDKDSTYKAMYRLTGMGPCDRVPCLIKDKVAEHLRDRIAKFQHNPVSLKFSLQQPDWGKLGWYTLVETSAGSSTCKALPNISCAGYPQSVKLPEYVSPSGELTITKNYDLRGACLVIFGGQKTVSLSLYELFDSEPGFKEFVSLSAGAPVEPVKAAMTCGESVKVTTQLVKIAGAAASQNVAKVVSPSKLVPQAWKVSDKLKDKLKQLKK